MARNRGLGHQRVHDAAEVTLPRIRRPPEQRSSSASEQARAFERGQRPHHGGGVARDHARRVTAQRRGVVVFGAERMPGDFVLLAPLHDEPDATLPIPRDVPGGHLLGRAIHDDVDLIQEVVQVPHGLETGRSHGRCVLRGGPIQGVPLPPGHADPPVGRHIRDPRQHHVLLGGHGVGDPLADDAVAVHAHAYLSRSVHVNLRSEVPNMMTGASATGPGSGRSRRLLARPFRAFRLKTAPCREERRSARGSARRP